MSIAAPASGPRRFGRPPRTALIAVGIGAIALIVVGALAAAGAPRRTVAIAAAAFVIVPCALYLLAFVHPVWLVSLGLFSTLFAGNWRSIGFPSLVSPDRFLFIAAIAAVVLRDPGTGERRPLRLTWTHGVLALASAYVIVSALGAGTLLARTNLYPLIDRFGLVPFVLFTVAPAVFATQRDRRILLGTMIVMAAYLAFIATAQGVGANALVYPRYILNTAIGAHQAGRARGPFADSAENGLALYMSAVACALAVYTWRSRNGRFLAGLIGVVCLFDELFTLERSVWIGAVAATIVTMGAVPRMRRFLPAVLALGALLVAGGLILVPGLHTQVNSRLQNQLTVWDRNNLNTAAENMFLARPLTGFGWGTYTKQSINFFQQAPNYPITTTGFVVHNVFLSNLAELGLIGTTVWALGLVLAIGGAIVRRGPPELVPWRVSLIAVFVAWLVVANLTPLLQPHANQTLWLWAGLCWPLRT